MHFKHLPIGNLREGESGPVRAHSFPVSRPGGVYVIANVAQPGSILFRCAEDYKLFLRIMEQHLGQVADTLGYLLTPYSYELLCRFRNSDEVRIRHTMNGWPDFRPVAAMLTHYVRVVNRRHDINGGMFPRNYRRIRIRSANELGLVAAGIRKAAEALDGAFQIPVMVYIGIKE